MKRGPVGYSAGEKKTNSMYTLKYSLHAVRSAPKKKWAPCWEVHLRRPDIIIAPTQLQRLGGIPCSHRLQRPNQAHRVAVGDFLWHLQQKLASKW